MLLKARRTAVTSSWIVLALILSISFAACNKSKKPSAKTFASPDEAGNALVQAAKSGDQNAVIAIFGPDSKEIIYSGDPAQDKAIANAFVTAYGAMHRWRKMEDGSEVLLVGVDNFPFAIPLKKNRAGQWFFDTAAGKDEVMARRIGRNELAVIDVTAALADAQLEYFSQPRNGTNAKQFAVKFISDGGKQNGLYWDSPEGQPKSPLGPLVAFATSEGYAVKPNAHVPFHGYFFRMLNRQGSHTQGGAKDFVVNGKPVGGFAFVAYPAEYKRSGIMTFIIGQDGVVYQKDLGDKTSDIAAAMTEYDPGDGWNRVVGAQQVASQNGTAKNSSHAKRFRSY
jgi:hypothetical protein